MNKVLDTYKTVAENYDGYHPHQFTAEDWLSFRHIQLKGDVLDIGCGTGMLLDQVHLQSYNGIDLSPDMIHQAHLKYPDYTFIVENLETMDLHQKFDTIVCLFGSGNYSPPEKLISCIETHLAPHGKAYVHYFGEGRNKGTLTAKIEIKNKVQAWYYSPEILTLFQSHFKVKIIKINAFLKHKEKWSLPLYKLSVWLESFLPIPDQYFSWILFELEKNAK